MALSDKDWLTTTLDCGDNSCLFKDPKAGGMRTNGGCRCFSDLRPQVKRIFVNKMYWELGRRQEALGLLLKYLTDWTKEIPAGLDPTFYHTGSYEGDLELKEQIDEIRDRYGPKED